MRLWDIDPGYLNRQSLLGEHRELHGIVSIITRGKKGYSRHPETIRWKGRGWALARRHGLLAAEMALRGYDERSPVRTRSAAGSWPETFVDEPLDQIRILREKYADREPGRIPLPKNPSELWSHHKYSVLARDQRLYKEIGREVAADNRRERMGALARTLVDTLRRAPSRGGLRNAVEHMWGHVSDLEPRENASSRTLAGLLAEVQRRAMASSERYLTSSTALGELAAWVSLAI